MLQIPTLRYLLPSNTVKSANTLRNSKLRLNPTKVDNRNRKEELHLCLSLEISLLEEYHDTQILFGNNSTRPNYRLPTGKSNNFYGEVCAECFGGGSKSSYGCSMSLLNYFNCNEFTTSIALEDTITCICIPRATPEKCVFQGFQICLCFYSEKSNFPQHVSFIVHSHQNIWRSLPLFWGGSSAACPLKIRDVISPYLTTLFEHKTKNRSFDNNFSPK